MDNPAPPNTERPHSGEAPPDHPPGPRVTRDEVKDLGRLRRSITDRHVGGVAGGLARHLDVDPILVRVAFVVAVFLGGAGLLAYAGAWILVPEEGTRDQPLGLDERSRAGALLGVGVLAVLAALADWVDAYWFPWPIAVLALGVLWFVNRNRTGRPSYDGYDGYDGFAPYDEDTVPPPGTPVTYARPARPRHPRKRGPILFWFTLALIALAEGILGVVHAAGADVVPSAYPTLALAITAAMLLLGSFWGRAGGLILVGLVAAVATGITTASSSWDAQSVRIAPDEAAEVADAYDVQHGDLLVDLSGIDDVDGLDGREVHVEGNAGQVEVVVPRGMDVSVSAEVAAGDVRIFDQRSDGLGITEQGFLDGGDDVPDMHITIDLGVGEVVVRES